MKALTDKELLALARTCVAGGFIVGVVAGALVTAALCWWFR